MKELSLHILDIAKNSVKAKAEKIEKISDFVKWLPPLLGPKFPPSF